MRGIAALKKHDALEVQEGSHVDPAIALLERGDYVGAVVLLRKRLAVQPTASDHGLLGTAYLLMEQYAEAKQELGLALEMDPDNSDWKDLQQKAMDDQYHKTVFFIG